MNSMCETNKRMRMRMRKRRYTIGHNDQGGLSGKGTSRQKLNNDRSLVQVF